LLVEASMTRPHPTLESIELSDLDAAAGGMRWDENSRQSTNVIDCRGPTCLDSNGEVDVKATMQHKYNIGHERKPLPKGDGGGLGLPRIPER
jgi:hypothetical protein